jgi:type VI secretion system secreted protein Hcp
VTTQGAATLPATGPNLRIIDTSAGQTCNTAPPALAGGAERSITWNQQGPQGPTGPQGVPGQTGAQGAPGQTGAQGPAVTIAAGHTLTLSGGQVITVGNPLGLTLAPPPISGTARGQVVLGTGREALTFDIEGLSLVNGGTFSSGGGGGAGKVKVHDISITKLVDKASPILFKAVATGVHYATVTIVLRKAGKGGSGGKVYLQLTLENTLVSSYQTSSGGDRPSESITLNFATLKIVYTKQKPKPK